MVRSGIADAAVSGGTEACINLGTLKGWEALRVMATDTCRPFSKGRKGLVIGEGAAMVVLETLDAARARGAEILAEIAGFGMSADAKDLTNPDVGGMSRAMNACLADAGLNREDVDYINAHGTGTLANDSTETEALKVTFGDKAKADPGLVDQVHGRPRARRRRSARVRRHASCHPRQHCPADHELSRAGPSLRSRLRA